MKHSALILFLVFVSHVEAQRSFTFYTRPTQMGYCISEAGEVSCFAGIDLTGYLMQINYTEGAAVTLSLFDNGAIIENMVSTASSAVKINKKQFNITCSNFEITRSFHLPVFTSGDHKMDLLIYLKSKKGTARFFYPENNKIYTYFFDVL